MEKTKILVVEDDKSLQHLYDIALPGDRFEKRFAADGTEAVTAYLSWRPRIVILDILLPGRSGYMVLEEIREKWQDKATTVIISSCLDDKTNISDCRQLGIQGYLVKPFDHKTLAAEVMRLHEAGQSPA